MNSFCLFLFVLLCSYADAVVIPVRKMDIFMVKGEILYSYLNSTKVRRVLDASMGSASETWNSYDLTGLLLKTVKIKSKGGRIMTESHGKCDQRSYSFLERIDNILFPVLGLSENIDTAAVTLEPGTRIVRGIPCKVYSCVGCVSGEHIPPATTVMWAVSGFVDDTIREVTIVFPKTVSGEYPNTITVSVAWLSHVASLSDINLSPSSCIDDISSRRFEVQDANVKAFSSTELNDQFPFLPPNFRALVETTKRGHQSSLLIEEEFSSSTTLARVSFIDKYLDVAGRSVKSTFVMDGNSQTAYHYISRQIPSGKTPLIEQGIRQYFWPADETCTKTIFGFNSMEGSTAKLLLVPDTPITRMGKASVRGVETDYWQINTGKLVVRWFFAKQEPHMTHRPLVRMIVSGKGSAPHLFPSHPFYQRGEPFPSKYAESACKALFPIDSACWDEESPNHYMYDFYGFAVGRQLYEKVDVPSQCRHAESINSYPPHSCQNTTTHDSIIILLFLCIGGGLGAFLMYIRMRRRLRYVALQKLSE
eukprot:Tbor_TRINITY_DN4766_c0_g1::TRINITY_DN4766_c0_g1_i1::g.16987::m.16987